MGTWEEVGKGVVSFTLSSMTCDVGGAEATPKSKGPVVSTEKLWAGGCCDITEVIMPGAGLVRMSAGTSGGVRTENGRLLGVSGEGGAGVFTDTDGCFLMWIDLPLLMIPVQDLEMSKWCYECQRSWCLRVLAGLGMLWEWLTVSLQVRLYCLYCDNTLL